MANDHDDSTGMDRRRFLVGTGVVAAGTRALESAAKAKGIEKKPKILGPNKLRIDLRVNDQTKHVDARPSATLAELLRDELGLTGTKVVCDRGACSACTVLVDDVPVLACTTFALDCVGKKVTTIEGLARGNELHPVQEAFIVHDAMQCGFCTPGMVMSCVALLQRNPNPTLDDVKVATSGNLCRCGTYPKVFEATLDAAKKTTISKG
jgi:aerobic-type carbon monoxide dehydrogenase small subunit (CoxS/CutS family)